MRASVLIGVMTLSTGWWVSAAAQVLNSPLYQPPPSVATPSWPAWQGMPDGRATLAAPQYIPAPRYPTDSRNLTLDNRAPTLWPAGPDLRDTSPRLGSLPENGALGTGARRPDGFR